MKHYFYSFIGFCFFLPAGIHAQCSLSLSATDSLVCSGNTVTITATATPANIGMPPLTTTFNAGNDHRGNMFDITATNTVTINSFDAHPMGNTTIEIYYRTSPYAGFETSSNGWILIGSAPVTAQSPGNPTPVPVNINVTIPAGQTYSFYVTSSNTGISLNYTDGSSEGAPYVSDANIVFRQGVGMEYPFSNGGSVFRPRVWNGVIHYSVPPPPPIITYLWNTSAVTQSISPMITGNSQFTVEVGVTGCPTLYDTIDIQVSTPPVFAGADTAVCIGSSLTLAGSGAVSYVWDNGVLDNILFTPVSSASYIVTGTDTIGCQGWDTVHVTVNVPSVYAGPDTTICAGSSITLAGSGASTYSWDNGVTNNVPFIPASPMAYAVTGTDSNNCVASDTVVVGIYTVNDTVIIQGETMTSATSGATYQWIDCNSGLPIAGATAQSYTATANGSYAVVITDNGCTDTSFCNTIVSLGVSENAASAFRMYPNPANHTLFIQASGSDATGLAIMNATGQIIEKRAMVNMFTTVDLSAYPAGVYIVQLYTGSGTHTQRLVKQ